MFSFDHPYSQQSYVSIKQKDLKELIKSKKEKYIGKTNSVGRSPLSTMYKEDIFRPSTVAVQKKGKRINPGKNMWEMVDEIKESKRTSMKLFKKVEEKSHQLKLQARKEWRDKYAVQSHSEI